MRLFLVLTSFSIFLSGCTSAPTTNANTTNVNTIGNSISETSNAKDSAPTMEKDMNAAAAPASNSNITRLSDDPTGKNPKKRVVNDAPLDPHAETILTAAPDNSVVSTSMNKQGAPIETRTFKNNPKLLKIERVYADLKNPTITVYLKNGKTVDLPKEKIPDIFNVPASEILKAVGVAPSK